jgi:hypothetical protein
MLGCRLALSCVKTSRKGFCGGLAPDVRLAASFTPGLVLAVASAEPAAFAGPSFVCETPPLMLGLGELRSPLHGSWQTTQPAGEDGSGSEVTDTVDGSLIITARRRIAQTRGALIQAAFPALSESVEDWSLIVIRHMSAEICAGGVPRRMNMAGNSFKAISSLSYILTLVKFTQMKASLTVRYISGREERFEVDFWGGTFAAARLKEFLKSPNIALQTSTELVLIPASAVESLSIALPEDEKTRRALEGIRVAKRLK